MAANRARSLHLSLYSILSVRSLLVPLPSHISMPAGVPAGSCPASDTRTHARTRARTRLSTYPSRLYHGQSFTGN